MSTFKFAGVSTLNGKMKARFANDQMRVKVLAKNGHKDIDIIELKNPMTKEDAVAFLLSINFDNGNKEVRAALEAAKEKRSEAPVAANKQPKKTKEAKKPKKEPAKKVSMETIKAKASAKKTADAELEDAPF